MAHLSDLSREQGDVSKPHIALSLGTWDCWPDGNFEFGLSLQELTDTKQLATNWVLETVQTRGSANALKPVLCSYYHRRLPSIASEAVHVRPQKRGKKWERKPTPPDRQCLTTGGNGGNCSATWRQCDKHCRQHCRRLAAIGGSRRHDGGAGGTFTVPNQTLAIWYEILQGDGERVVTDHCLQQTASPIQRLGHVTARQLRGGSQPGSGGTGRLQPWQRVHPSPGKKVYCDFLEPGKTRDQGDDLRCPKLGVLDIEFCDVMEHRDDRGDRGGSIQGS
ncbi:hypothetical protein GGX14DRAFT_394481 [Mycena pura]|uniref:Uncharacterized protein n=1 Tax=Mycena pura TaxID=153505 RepID=A0AAD6VEV1_9AGAR|nr:hypothetical protein GGX14DRAFT_394481 [Mycena pura]